MDSRVTAGPLSSGPTSRFSGSILTRGRAQNTPIPMALPGLPGFIPQRSLPLLTGRLSSVVRNPLLPTYLIFATTRSSSSGKSS